MNRRFTLALLAAAFAGACSEPQNSATSDEEPAADTTAWFVDEAASRGLQFVHVSGQIPERWLMPEIMGGGGALFDADADGDLDVYLVQGGSVTDTPANRPGNQLFINDGTGRFTDTTRSSGAGDRGYGMGVACGDVDNDGDVDLYVTNVGPNVLLTNDGDATFTDVSAAAGVDHGGWGTSAAFVDVDADGWLDLYVVNYLEWSAASETSCTSASGTRDYCSPQSYQAPARDVLYRNLGGQGQPGVFEDVSVSSGVASIPGTGLGIGCADVDGNGTPEIFVANDGMPDLLWMGGADDPWTLTDGALLAGCAVDHSGRSKAGMGVALADIDDDDDVDLIVCNLDRQSDSFFLNDGTGLFDDATPRAGLAATSRPFTRFGMGFLDVDHDGRLDLFQANGRVAETAREHDGDPYAETNLVLRGVEGPRFEPVETADGTASPDVATSRAAVFGDVDGDGAIDVLVVNRDTPAQLLMNVAPKNGTHWFGAALVTRDGRPALGATLRATVADRVFRRDARAASSYLASNDPRVHIGLSTADAVSDITVTWPDGQRESFGALGVDMWHTLRQGTGETR